MIEDTNQQNRKYVANKKKPLSVHKSAQLHIYTYISMFNCMYIYICVLHEDSGYAIESFEVINICKRQTNHYKSNKYIKTCSVYFWPLQVKTLQVFQIFLRTKSETLKTQSFAQTYGMHASVLFFLLTQTDINGLQ